MDLKCAFGKRLREIRQQKKFTQFELAERSDIDEKHLSNIERGINFPRADLLEKFAEILDVDISDFFQLKHIKQKQVLINEIVEKLENFSDKDLRYIYKVILNYPEK